MENLERRSFLRVPFKLKSETILKSRDARIAGTIKNLSLVGAFINTPGKIEQDTDVEIEIILHDPQPSVSVILNARVVRLAPDGVGIRFTGMPTDVRKRLRESIEDIHGDNRHVVAEFLEYMNVEAYR